MVLQSIRRRCVIRKDYLPQRKQRLLLEELEALCLLASGDAPLSADGLAPPHGTGTPIVTTLVGTGKGHARAIAAFVDLMLAMPDEDPPGAWEEAMRDLDAHRPHRKLFEGLY